MQLTLRLARLLDTIGPGSPVWLAAPIRVTRPRRPRQGPCIFLPVRER